MVNDSKEEKLDRKISRLGGRKIVLIKKEPVFTPLKILLVIIELKKMLVKGRYNIFHIHCSNGQGLLYAYIAKLANIPVRIVHIHNTAVDGKFVIFKRLFHELCKNYLYLLQQIILLALNWRQTGFIPKILLEINNIPL